MLILYIVAFLVILFVIAFMITKIRGNTFNKKVQAYSDRHVHKVLVNYVYNFIAIDVNSQELTYISPGKQMTFKRNEISDVRIVEKETPGDSESDGPEEYSVNVLITLQDAHTIKINCVQSAPRGSFLYNNGYNAAQEIADAIVKQK